MDPSASQNPYAPPTADEVFAPDNAGFVYQPTSGIATVLRILLGVCVAVSAVNMISMVMQVDLLERAQGGNISMAEAEANDTRVMLIAGLYLIALITTGIVWFVWQNRTSKNARALGATNMEFGPNAWGWFFCPIVNLWRPVSVISELWHSLPQLDDRGVPTGKGAWTEVSPPTWLIAGWWIPWLLSGIISQISVRMAADTDIDTLISASQMEIASDVFGIVSGVFALVLVTMLQKRVEARAERGAGSVQIGNPLSSRRW